MDLPAIVTLKKKEIIRIVPSKFPPINFFEDLIDPADMEIAYAIENMTNDRLRQEVGDISLVATEDRISGNGSTVIMAAFTHIHYPSRFSDGSYGVYYAARSMQTAIKETSYHREQFLAATNQAAGELDMRVYQGEVIKPLHDLRDETFKTCLSADDYHASQQLGKTLKTEKSWGLIYPSVRHSGGECVAALRPKAVSIPVQSCHLCYVWDGKQITTVYEKKLFL